MKPQTKSVLNKIKTSKNLPTLPHILLKLINACNNHGVTVKDISKIIDKDSSLSAKVMKMINSVHYGLPTRITSIEQALLLLGTDAVKNIAVSAAVFQVFGAARGNGIFNLKSFWRHCLLCASMAKLIAKKTSYSSAEEAFLSGLLHDIGKLVLWVNFPREYAEVLQSSKAKTDLPMVETNQLGITHSEVGAWMIGKWHLQSFMADAVLYHHESAGKILDALPLVKVVFLANVLTTDSVGEDNVRFEAADKLFAFTRLDVEQLISENNEQAGQIAQSLGMEIKSQESPESRSDVEHQEEVDLLRSVKDFALLQGTLQNLLEAYGKRSILAVVKQGFQILLDANNVLFLLYDTKKNALVGEEGSGAIGDARIKELRIPLETTNCLPVQCIEQKKPLDSLGYFKEVDLAIIDSQLIRLVGGDGILCLPMIAHRRPVGVIVLGMEQAHASSLHNSMNLLSMLAGQAALALYADGVRQAQARLVQSERLEAASAVASKVAHEVNNPLGIIKNYVKVLSLKLPDEDPVQEQLRIISEELDRVALIVRKLSDFSEPEARQTEPVDVNALLSDLVKLIRESVMLESKIDVKLNLEPSLPTIFSEKNSLKQVFINLIKNAAESISSGGNLYITTESCPKALTDKSHEGLQEACKSVRITISDDGPGIPDAVKAKLFEPFVTSKKGQHAGLGLSVVYNIVKELNGTITCKSDKESGTVFDIVLPVNLQQVS
ncbi:MAG: HDOD domain-containing protein [Deltaproteobacteria bacterium]|nr:HDOD domain-containing protein [Deltaproteobacteria bacterium]MBW2600455.1 HDOD domain-containing protein [Deltaproteobacteria bacterium]